MEPTYPVVVLGSQFVGKVIPYVERAVHSIDIIVFDWRLPIDAHANPVAELLSALQTATTRGVSVRVLTSNVAIGERLKQYGFDVRVLYSRKLVHCKTMIIDNIFGVVGSHNYTTSAFTQNLEASLIVRFASPINDLSTFFTHLWGV